ncbi:hypothetical protein F2P44_29605 [Massilia sp. CCM 8695]|uniref:Beta-ketoacyl synthase N-terminal domain-containing protein n=1 Tax=Massilia frigida TaxID=2609281 RepID=A0ABX0NJN6_9BURK|nr:hypothetical protein [Massilia frigida]NHZ83390.1 hypothetical protein [Massilia frigida]
MKTLQIAISCAGLVTSVGLDTNSTCAALRCRLNNFVELDDIDYDAEPLVGAPVLMADFDQSGIAKLAAMAASAIAQTLGAQPGRNLIDIPLLLCVAEPGRAGRLVDLDSALFGALANHFSHGFHAESAIIAAGKSAVALALTRASRMLSGSSYPAVMIVAADTFLNYGTVAANLASDRMMATEVRAGFIPGEAAGALLVTRSDIQADVELVVFALASTTEEATFAADLPLRANGLAAAIKSAAKKADAHPDDLAICLSDVSGEDYYFEELALAQARARIEALLWLPAESVGETGSVIGCIQIAWLLDAKRQFYLPGNTALLLTSDDDGRRTASILAFQYSKAYTAASLAQDPINDLINEGVANVT